MPNGLVIETGISGYKRCVDVPAGHAAANGERPHQWDCDVKNFNQLFELEHTAGNWYRVGHGGMTAER